MKSESGSLQRGEGELRNNLFHSGEFDAELVQISHRNFPSVQPRERAV